MTRSSRDKPLDRLRDAARDEAVRRAAVATAAAVGAGAAAKVTLDLRSAAHAPETDREYALHPGEELAPGLRRVARGQIDTAIELLTPRDGTLGDDAVHDARKALKRLRALARLLRGELGTERYRVENDALRDTGRRLSGARDAEVLVDTLQDVIDDELDGAATAGVAALRAELVVERQIARERLLGDAGTAEAAVDALRAVRGRAAHWMRPEAGFDAVAPGLDRIYRQGRRRGRRAQSRPTAESLHDWRKRVKDLRHAAEVLAPANPKRMRKLAKRADRLGETLGAEHDLAVLGGLVSRRRGLFADRAEHDQLARAIERRRTRLRHSALKRGSRLYDRKPRRFVKRIARDWRAAQD
jgi:CHAD domain-containing protein